MENKTGFTLVELLAVIVVLAIILAIAVPSITGVIQGTTSNAFESNAKMILKAVDLKKLSDPSFNPTDVKKETLDSLLGLPADEYESITVTTESGVTIIAVIGEGSWKGLVACGTYKSMRIVQSLSACSGDLVAPVISIDGDNPVNINAGSIYTDAGAIAIDNVDGDVSDDIAVDSNVNPMVPGTYTVTYTVSDSAGNVATATRTVNVHGDYVVTYNGNGGTCTPSSEWVVSGNSVSGSNCTRNGYQITNYNITSGSCAGTFTASTGACSIVEGNITINANWEVYCNPSTCEGCNIGATCGGGKYFYYNYYDSSRYIAAPSDEASNYNWTNAASRCDSVTYGGFDDWFFGDSGYYEELFAIKGTIGGFASDYYWTNTETHVNGPNAWALHFGNEDYLASAKTTLHKVRCIRKTQ